MKAIRFHTYGGPEVLQVREVPDLVPGKGQVRIAVTRAGINFADIAGRVGLYPDAPKPPMVMGYEVAVTPLQLVSAYSAIANGGELLEPHIVKEVRSLDGKVLYHAEPRPIRLEVVSRTA